MPSPTNTQYAVAVHVLAYLAAADRDAQVSSDELALSTNTNPVYVRRVLGPLREAGIVRSRPGAHGGWQLAREPGAIGLDDVWSIVNGADPVLALHGPNPNCAIGVNVQRVLTGLDRDVERAVRAQLGQHTVRDVLTFAAPRARRTGRRAGTASV